MACGVGRYRRCGRELRSRKPSWPSLRYRSTHLRTVRGQTPAASLTAFGVCPLATCRAIRSRPRGVRRAFLCTFIRFSLGILKSQQPQSPRSEPDGQPIESSQLERVGVGFAGADADGLVDRGDKNLAVADRKSV